MKSLDNRISYQKITQENIVFATEVEMKIFPYVCAYLSYKNSFENKNQYFLAYFEGKVCGITGIYEDLSLADDDKTLWLGWFGVLPEFRRKGIGTQMLIDTIKEAKKMGAKTFRLYTTLTRCPEAAVLYDKIMDIGEDYTFDDVELERRVYSKSLTKAKVVPWNNRSLNLNQNHEQEKQAREIFEKIKKDLKG